MWLRLDDEVLDDPKVQKLPPSLFKAWVNLLCLANKSEIRGILPSLEDIAFRLRMSEEEAQSVLTQLVERGLLDETQEGLTPHNWQNRQPESDDAAKRMREYRERNRRSERPKTPLRTCSEHVTNKFGLEEKEIYIRVEGEGVRAGAHESAPPASPSPPPSLESETITPAQEKRLNAPPVEPVTDKPRWWRELEKDFSPEEIVEGKRVMAERGKEVASMSAGQIVGYMRKLLPDIRARGSTDYQPPERSAAEVAAEKQAADAENERQRAATERKALEQLAKLRRISVDELIEENSKPLVAGEVVAGFVRRPDGQRGAGERGSGIPVVT